ncbi:AcfA family outer membrane beta-barrel protein [Vibrio sp. 1CM2L]|uniref:AcfA family outer membrane beta-barrel protein n=1 Tax=Vibrio pomeroyi TaxID=198832 RepID=A0ABV4MXX0_9VIBR|nr:AcfA family outer membrane beta-barrel protein [Vibrio sp. 1CM2L]
MKKTILVALALNSFSVAAAPYVGLEYGFGSTDHDFETSFQADGVNLNPELEDGILGGFVGYAINESWAIELGYSQFELDDERSKNMGIADIEGQMYQHEMEWDSSIKAKQITLAPVFSYAVSDKWTTKIKAGVTYTQYESSVRKSEEFELVVNDDVELNNTLFHRSEKNNEFGAVVSIGAEYEITSGFTVGANAKYQLDSYANTASLNVSSTYYF